MRDGPSLVEFGLLVWIGPIQGQAPLLECGLARAQNVGDARVLAQQRLQVGNLQVLWVDARVKQLHANLQGDKPLGDHQNRSRQRLRKKLGLWGTHIEAYLTELARKCRPTERPLHISSEIHEAGSSGQREGTSFNVINVMTISAIWLDL